VIKGFGFRVKSFELKPKKIVHGICAICCFAWCLGAFVSLRLTQLSAEIVPKLSVLFVGHGFSRAKILATNYFANLKVRPAQKYLNFDTASAES
jgi:hypothetical protein